MTPVPTALARPLVGSLINETVADPAKSIDAIVSKPPEGLIDVTTAINLALSRTSSNQVETRWSDATAPTAPWQKAQSDPDSVFVFGEAIAAIAVPPQVECLGYTIPFGNNSQNAISYAWDFGNGVVSAAATPTITFPGPGVYPVSLIASSSPICQDTTQVNVTRLNVS